MRRTVLPLLLATPFLLMAAPEPAMGEGRGLMEANGTIRVGQEAPPIEAVDLGGKAFSLAAIRGRPVFVDFGSVLCEACAEMVKEINRLEKKYGSTDLEIVMIVDGSMPVPATEAFFSKLKASFRVVRDAQWEVFDSYGVTVVPFKVLIDRQGRIRTIHLGFDSNLDKIMDFSEALRQ
jgi:peroxiredoxin